MKTGVHVLQSFYMCLRGAFTTAYLSITKTLLLLGISVHLCWCLQGDVSPPISLTITNRVHILASSLNHDSSNLPPSFQRYIYPTTCNTRWYNQSQFWSSSRSRKITGFHSLLTRYLLATNREYPSSAMNSTIIQTSSFHAWGSENPCILFWPQQ